MAVAAIIAAFAFVPVMAIADSLVDAEGDAPKSAEICLDEKLILADRLVNCTAWIEDEDAPIEVRAIGMSVRAGLLMDLAALETAQANDGRAAELRSMAFDQIDAVVEMELDNMLDALVRRAGLHAAVGNWDRAIGDLDHGLAIEPESYGTLVARADLNMQIGRYREALEDYRTALRLEPPFDIDLAIRFRRFTAVCRAMEVMGLAEAADLFASVDWGFRDWGLLATVRVDDDRLDSPADGHPSRQFAGTFLRWLHRNCPMAKEDRYRFEFP